jgi:hypothetical protein
VTNYPTMDDANGVFATALPDCKGVFLFKEADEIALNMRDDSPADMAKFMVAFWQFVRQRIFVMSTGRPPQKLMRKAKKQNKPLPPEVNIITLRAIEREVQREIDSHDVDWSHRWVVRGHWRKQWYASTKTHDLIWIAPYIKGPDDAPLVVKEKRFEVVR